MKNEKTLSELTLEAYQLSKRLRLIEQEAQNTVAMLNKVNNLIEIKLQDKEREGKDGKKPTNV
ncbi:MAG TPA: hypothetical protein VMV77_09310 [Bacteroidales bacterium]|nr:hypothetical protein [Bacteroidales bacterium]